MGQRVKKLHGANVELGTAVQSHSAPSASTDGIALASVGGYREDIWEVYFDLVTTSPIAISAGAYVCGYDEQAEKWRRLGDLNGGNAITLTTGVGYAERMVDLGAYSRLAVVATGDQGTNVYGATPIEHL